ncbi:hypothetical protein [Ruania alba]|nr:hypothetical protein [Ruania alba]
MSVHAESVREVRSRRRSRAMPDPDARSWWLHADHPLPLGLRRPEDGPMRVVAATECTLLAGFRDPVQIAANLDRLGVHGLTDVISVLRRPDRGEALLYALGLLFATGRTAQISLARRAAVAAAQCGDEPVLRRMVELARHHGDDPGLLLSVFLHEQRLAPGDVLQIGAGMVHGLLSGRGLHVARTRGAAITVGLSLEPIATGAVLQRLDARVGPARLVPGVGQDALRRYPAEDGVSLAQVAAGRGELTLGPSAAAAALDQDGWVEVDGQRWPVLAHGLRTDLPAGQAWIGTPGRMVLFCDAGPTD